MTEGTLLLSRSDVASLLSIEDYISSIERAFQMYGEGKTDPPGILGVHARDGGFHIKAGLLDLDRFFFAAKVNANFPQNVKRFGLPLIQGVIVLADAENGSPLAVMDSIEITIQRTGAATAVAAKYLARPDSRSLTICGCGNQGRVSLKALSKAFSFQQVFAFDIDAIKARQFASDLSQELQLKVIAVEDVTKATNRSDIVVTSTPSNEYFLKAEDIRAGTFIAAVGADSETKQELEPALVANNKIVVDVLEQSALIGELHHALEDGLMTKSDVYAELGQVVAGSKAGRTLPDEIIIFDSTGMALQDVIAAATIYEQAKSKQVGTWIDFAN
jgi:alanine dehydrogenase